MLSSSLKAALTGVVKSPIQWNVPLSAMTTFRIGGPAEALVTLLDLAELRSVLTLLKQEEVEYKVLGRGSNILASDHGYGGIILQLGGEFTKLDKLDTETAQTVAVRVGAGLSLPRFANWCAAEGCSGAEFLAGIPGSVGGGLLMNGGAWGQEMRDIVQAAETADHAGVQRFEAAEMGFAYRTCAGLLASVRNGRIVTSVDFRLQRGEQARIRERVQELLRKRMETQPLGEPTAGSVFKNPEGHSAGQLIEASNLKGLRLGDAQVSEKHANFIVNRGAATAIEVSALIREIQRRVASSSGILLEPEIEIVGQD